MLPRMRTFASLVLLPAWLALSAHAAGPLCDPWQSPYSGAAATGRHVIACWQFRPGTESADSGPNRIALRLQGAASATQGPFGASLESFPGFPIEDRKHAAVATNHPALTPAGAFTLEAWFCLKPGFADYGEAFILDKKYAGQTDYQWTLGGPDKSGRRALVARLGFGETSETWSSEPAAFEPGAWHHAAFTYDGQGGGRFYLDGQPAGGADKPGAGPVARGPLTLSIGDRHGSYYHGFPGHLAQVRICSGVREFRRAAVSFVSDRTAFVRMEPGVELQFGVTNLQSATIEGATLTFESDGVPPHEVKLPALEGGGSCAVAQPFDTTLRPDRYRVRATLRLPGAAAWSATSSFDVTLVPRPPPFRMPVVMWGIGSPESVLKELPRLKELGFTHCLGLGADYGLIRKAGGPVAAGDDDRVAASKRMLNEALAQDLGIIASLSPGHALEDDASLWRVHRDGRANTNRPSVCALTPGLSNHCWNVGASMARTYGRFPAFRAALIHTEVRDSASLCFHEHDRAAFRAATGADIPEYATGKGGTPADRVPGFPASRIVPDDHPLLTYLRWFWKRGDGWNDLNTAVHLGLKSGGRTDLWTFHDPAVRVASVYGSGGAVDVISQWTYSYPDPIRIGLAADELFAMARGAAAPQDVMKMTQIIWYRSQTAPARTNDPARAASRSPWEDTDPDAAFLTIAPMHLREAFWTKIARPVRGIMYHGWQSLVPCDGGGSYRFTHPETRHELRRLVREVVEPLGPALLQVPDAPADVAFLESFASQVFAGRGTYGWGRGWGGDAWHAVQYAHLQPQIVYDETVQREGLDRFRVLVLADCDVLTESVAKRVAEFQRRGGIVVGDERLPPSIRPDLLLPVHTRTGRADEDRAALVRLGGKLRADLGNRYRRGADSDASSVIPRLRRFGTTDYLFAVNDEREYGSYVGMHGLVMEDGRATSARLSLDRKAGHVYDLVAGRPVEAPVRAEGGRLSFEHRFGPCEGRVFMVTDRPVERVKIEMPENARRGEAMTLRVAVTDAGGTPVDAVLPVRVDIRDPQGRPAEFSGWYGAKAGRLEIPFAFAGNDVPGEWEIRAKELASGRSAMAIVRLVR